MRPYPPTIIKTPDGIVNILQLTDLHLYKNKHIVSAGINVNDSFIACLEQALAENIRCDLILLTGDLIDELDNSIYDRLFVILDQTDIPFICMPGNHDVTQEVNLSPLTFSSQNHDKRLIGQYSFKAENWQIVLLDSSCPGHINGVLSTDKLEWLSSILTNSVEIPTLIALHHHPLPVNSLWLDEYILADHDSFWNTIKPYTHVKAIVNGHVHQEYFEKKDGIACYMTPSTCYQFKPKEDEYSYDKVAKAGYRWLKLKDNGTIDSWVERLNSQV